MKLVLKEWLEDRFTKLFHYTHSQYFTSQNFEMSVHQTFTTKNIMLHGTKMLKETIFIYILQWPNCQIGHELVNPSELSCNDVLCCTLGDHETTVNYNTLCLVTYWNGLENGPWETIILSFT